MHANTNLNTIQIKTHIPWLERSVSGVSNSRCICIYMIAVLKTCRKTWQKWRKTIQTEHSCTFCIISTLECTCKDTSHSFMLQVFLSQQHYLISLQDCIIFRCDFMSVIEKATSYVQFLSRLIHSLWIIAESTALLTLCLCSCVTVTETFVSGY